MQTVNRFYEEVAKIGYEVTLKPDFDNAYADKANRQIVLGLKGRSLTDAAIIGLHELGHANVTGREAIAARVSHNLFGDEASMYAVYADELAAWAWAWERIAPEDKPVAEAIKAHALDSYAYSRTVSDMQAAPGSVMSGPVAQPSARPQTKRLVVTEKKITDFVKF